MATDTTEQFDPYRKWLGIPPKDQPPHHYRLLGIAAFESDPDVIQNAADRQMAHVRNFQAGKHSNLSQRILNELAAAKLCLLTEAKKSEYDQELRVQLRAKKAAAAQAKAPAAAATTPVASVPAPPPAAAVPTATAEPPSEEPSISPSPKIAAARPVIHRRRRKKNNAMPIAIAVICLAVLVVGGLVVMSQLGDNKGKSSSKGNNNAGDNSDRQRTQQSTDPSPNKSTRPSPSVGTKLPTTNGSKRTESGDPLKSAFSNPKTGEYTPPPVDRDKELRDALQRVRHALATRDYDAAATTLAKAYELNPNSDHSDKLNHLRDLSAFVKQFWDVVGSGAKNLEESGAFDFQGRRYEFVSRDGKNLTFRVNDVEITKPLRELEPSHALALALHHLDEDDFFERFYTIAFLAVDNRGDIGAQRKLAEEMMRELLDDGHTNQMLVAELNLESGIPLPMPDDSPESLPMTPLGGLDTPADDSLAPVPSPEDLEDAEAALQVKAQLKLARTISQKTKLANDLNEKAGKEDDLAKKYELWMTARELAVEMREVNLSMTIIESMAQTFAIDALSQKQEVLADLAAKLGVDIKAVSEHANQLFDDAVSKKEFEVARRVGDIRIRAAKRMKQFDEVGKIETELEELEQQRKAAESDQDAEVSAGT